MTAPDQNARSESVRGGHTPGSWVAEQYGGTREDSWFVYSPLGRICGGANKVSGPDALLIAAAPELLAACEAFVTTNGPGNTSQARHAAFMSAKAAIAKALGQ